MPEPVVVVGKAEVTLINKTSQVLSLTLKEKWARGATKSRLLLPQARVDVSKDSLTPMVQALADHGHLKIVE